MAAPRKSGRPRRSARCWNCAASICFWWPIENWTRDCKPSWDHPMSCKKRSWKRNEILDNSMGKPKPTFWPGCGGFCSTMSPTSERVSARLRNALWARGASRTGAARIGTRIACTSRAVSQQGEVAGEQNVQLEQAVAQLPALYQETLRLRHQENCSFEEIGERMGRKRRCRTQTVGASRGTIETDFEAKL